jgi:hypothetical protein
VSPGLEPGQDGDLLAPLRAVPDPRHRRVRRHQLVTVLALSVATVLAGARSYVAIAEWAHDLPVSALVRLGVGRRSPSESTIRRILALVDLDALDTVLSAWLATLLPTSPTGRPGSICRVVAVDGKTAPGAPTGRRCICWPGHVRPGQRCRARPDRGGAQVQRGHRVRAAA